MQVPRGTATMFLMVGLPRSRETTRARELAAAHQAVRLTPDHWMIPLALADMIADTERLGLYDTDPEDVKAALKAARMKPGA